MMIKESAFTERSCRRLSASTAKREIRTIGVTSMQQINEKIYDMKIRIIIATKKNIKKYKKVKTVLRIRLITRSRISQNVNCDW